MLLLPAVIWDRDGRGLHDRFSATAVVRGNAGSDRFGQRRDL
jgi:hypothetical protein